MPKILCIVTDTANKMREAIKKGKDGGIDFAGLYDMNSSEERRAEWEKVVDKDTAKFFNTHWEAAAAKNTKSAMSAFIKRLITPKDGKTKQKDLLQKIEQIYAKLTK
jgi:hypothetical protein